jgi:hypothetical protein
VRWFYFLASCWHFWLGLGRTPRYLGGPPRWIPWWTDVFRRQGKVSKCLRWM